MNSYMVQYGVWPNCCNNCDFCLIKDRNLSKSEQINTLRKIRENLNYVDWEGKFSSGISLLGGELYYVQDKDLQQEFLLLIDDIIDKILTKSKNPNCRYSTVTNGMYNPEFLYKVIDKIVDKVGIGKVDINFSFDLKYRFKNDSIKHLVLNNINDFHKRYNYRVGVQMILTQYLINLWDAGKFSVNDFIKENMPGNNLQFLFPHTINRGNKSLKDFKFSRKDLFRFLEYLKSDNFNVFISFLLSTYNSSKFKYTGYSAYSECFNSVDNQPKLTDLKEVITDCGHSLIYRCYSDSNKCLLCDLISLYKHYFEEYKDEIASI